MPSRPATERSGRSGSSTPRNSATLAAIPSNPSQTFSQRDTRTFTPISTNKVTAENLNPTMALTPFGGHGVKDPHDVIPLSAASRRRARTERCPRLRAGRSADQCQGHMIRTVELIELVSQGNLERGGFVATHRGTKGGRGCSKMCPVAMILTYRFATRQLCRRSLRAESRRGWRGGRSPQ